MVKTLIKISRGTWIALLLVFLLPLPGVAAEAPQAMEGLIDLSEWDFNRRGPVELRGEFEFYWEQFLGRRELLTVTPEQFVRVPQPWNGTYVGDDAISGHGFATYRLNILIPPDVENLSFKFLDFGTSARIFLDGKLMTQIGHPGTQSRSTQAAYKPQIIDFKPERNRVELVLHIANFNHRSGGLWETIHMGLPDQIRAFRDNEIAKELLLFGALLMIAIFNLAFFVLKPDRFSNLFLALFCAFAGLRIIAVEERYFLTVFPNLPFELYSKLEYLSWYVLIPLFAHFLQSLYPREVDRRFIWILDGISLFVILIVLLMPLGIFSYTAPFMQVFHVLALVYGLYALLLARRHRREGANILLFGFLLLMACTVNDILIAAWIIDSTSLVDVGIVGFAVCQSILASYDFARSVSTVEKQYEQLATSSLKLQTQEKLRMEAELQSRKVSARFRESQQFEALGILAHGVVSDLKEAFRQSAEQTREAASKLEENQELIESLARTQQVADRSVAVIEDLLSLSTFDNEKHATDLNRVVSEYLDSEKIRNMATSTGVVIERQLMDAIQPIVGSTLHLQRILENLVANAFENQSSGGRTLVTTEQIYTDGRTLFFDSIEGGYYVVLSVDDKGAGIHPEDLDSIFQPFFSRHESSARRSGLGMSVVRTIVRQLNGGIDVISELGQGTRFDVYLPVSVPKGR